MKKKLIIAAIVIAIIVGVMLYMHYTPFWVNLTTVVSFGVGVVAGWVARLVYDKYFKDGDAKRNVLTEFNSNNTKLLNVEEVKQKMLSLRYIRDELEKMGIIY